MENSQGSKRQVAKTPRLQISCSTLELHRRSGQKTPFLDNPATPAATPQNLDGGASTAPDAGCKPSRRGALHALLINEYVERNPGTQTHGFAATVSKLLRRLRDLRFVPDAFRVDREERALTMVEAQVTSVITPQKWLDVAELFWDFDRNDRWFLRLDLVDRSGAVYGVNLQVVAIALCGDRLQRREALADLLERPPGRLIWPPTPSPRSTTLGGST